MSFIYIDKEKCIGCGTCVDVCSAGALTLDDGYARVDDANCIACSVCVGSCPVEAISADTGESAGYNGSIVVFAERKDGKFMPVVGELLGKARELAVVTKSDVVAVALGNGLEGPEKEAEILGSLGADRYILAPGRRFDVKCENAYRDALCDILSNEKPAVVLIGATLFGRGVAPGIAAALHTGLTADCTVLEINEETGLLEQTRPAFGGNLMATIVCANHRPQMSTVRPGVMKASLDSTRPAATLTLLKADDRVVEGYEILSETLSETKSNIADARIIIDCGRGIGSKKNLKLVRELASRLGAAVGCTRPLVDTGFCEYSSQIGQTGSTVSPDLLICLGISGAIQHIAGIGGAKKIIAVNSDPDAPIFASADVEIVADCMDVVREMLEKTK